MRQIIAVLFLAIFSLTATAEDVRYYDVEIVLFENLEPSARQSEVWGSDAQTITPETFIELGLPYPGPMPKEFIPANTFKPLQNKALRLGQEVSFLKKSDRYRVLMHLGWRQPGMSADNSLAVHLERLVPPLETSVLDTTSANIQESTAVADGKTVYSPPTTPANYTLNGFIRLSLSRYLHVNADLVYGQERSAGHWSQLFDADSGEATVTESLPPVFHLLQSRRMRSGELHYLDHPVLGMLILVSPVETTKSPS